MDAGRLIGVLDVKAGRVVHATGGRRSDYRPVDFPWLGSADPRPVASRLASRYGLSTFYLADLDALTGGPRQLDVYAGLAEAGYELWVDSGLADVDSWLALPEETRTKPALRWVLGTETVRDAASLAALGQTIGWNRCVVSVDLRGGAMLLGCGWNSTPSPVDLVAGVVRAGTMRVLVLELASVGAAAGPADSRLRRQLRSEFPQLELWYGGGVRDVADVDQLEADGVDRVLVATALFRQTLG